jgi:hypothetical protein
MGAVVNMPAKSEMVISAVCEADGQYDCEKICYDLAGRDCSPKYAGGAWTLCCFHDPEIDSKHFS